MRIVPATAADIARWLALAAEVEPLFGPMVRDSGFRAALRRHIARGTALCAREGDGPPGTPLLGGLLWSPHPPRYEIDWLAVAGRWQRTGVGRALVEHVLDRVQPPAEVTLLTFAAEVAAGQPARAFYASLGFQPGEPGPINPAGIPTQVFRRVIGRPPTARAVIQDGERTLLVQHHYANPANDGKWSLPGGGIDRDDPDHAAALRRELREEFGIEVTILRLLGVFAHADREHFIYHVQPNTTALTPDPAEIAAIDWFTLDEVRALAAADRLFAPFVLDAIQTAHTPQQKAPGRRSRGTGS